MKVLRSALAGAVGGLAGAVLMGPLHAMAAKVSKSRPPQGEDATEKVANSIATVIGKRKLRGSQKQQGGQIVHYAFAATVGALYGVAVSAFPSLKSGTGTLLGAAVYVGAHTVTVPALGLAPGPVANGAAREGAELAAHLAYGVVTEKVRRVLA